MMEIILQIMLCLFCLFLLLVVIGAGAVLAEMREDLDKIGIEYREKHRHMILTERFEIPEELFQKELQRRLEQEKAKRN